MSVIIDLFTGDIDLTSKSMTKIPGWQSASDRAGIGRDAFAKTLTEAQKEQFNRVENNWSALVALEEQDAFREGFRLGARIMREICVK